MEHKFAENIQKQLLESKFSSFVIRYTKYGFARIRIQIFSFHLLSAVESRTDIIYKSKLSGRARGHVPTELELEAATLDSRFLNFKLKKKCLKNLASLLCLCRDFADFFYSCAEMWDKPVSLHLVVLFDSFQFSSRLFQY